MPATITFIEEHNHETTSAFSLHSLRASEETIAQYRKYYEEGLTAVEAVNVHEFKLVLENEENETILANAAFNMNLKTARRKFAAWDEKRPLRMISKALDAKLRKQRSAKNLKGRLMDQMFQKKNSDDSLEVNIVCY